jgi:peptidyl-prolyl cis-trans isomerase C
VFRVLPLIAILLVGACSKSPVSASTAQAEKPAAAPATAQAPAAEEPVKPVPAQLPEVIARVNGEAIGRTDFEKAIKNLEGRAGAPVPTEQRDRVYRSVLEQLVAYRLLTQETKARNVAVPETDVDARLADIRKQFPSEDVFKQMLTKQNMTVEQLREDARADMRVALMLKSEVAVSVQPKDVADFYQQNPDKFQQGERVRASHILVRVPENADEKAKQTARAKADDLLKQVKAGGDFAALAKQHSEDPGSGANGGDLGYFTQGQMVGAFERAAFALKPGEVSDLVETPFGFHIIKMADKQASRTVPMEEVRAKIEEFLQNRQRMEKTQAFVESLKAKGKVEILI